MKHLTASLMLLAAACHAADNVVFDIHRHVECRTANEEYDHPGYFCRAWKERLVEEGQTAILCKPAADPDGMRMLGCSPSWIRSHPASSRRITAAYRVARHADGERYLQATIDYPETTSGERLLCVLVLASLAACVCCAPPPGPDSESDNFLTGAVVGSMLGSGDGGPSLGGTDYTKDE